MYMYEELDCSLSRELVHTTLFILEQDIRKVKYYDVALLCDYTEMINPGRVTSYYMYGTESRTQQHDVFSNISKTPTSQAFLNI